MAKKPTDFDQERYQRERDAMHEATRAKHARAIAVIRQLIAEENLIVWIARPGKSSLLLNAVDVSVNGHSVQIETEEV